MTLCFQTSKLYRIALSENTENFVWPQATYLLNEYEVPAVFSPGFFLRVSQIRKFGITKIYACRTLAIPEGIAIYRLTRYR